MEIYQECQYECKNFRKCKKDYCWNPSACVCENNKYSNIIADDLKIVCDKIIHVIEQMWQILHQQQMSRALC